MTVTPSAMPKRWFRRVLLRALKKAEAQGRVKERASHPMTENQDPQTEKNRQRPATSR
jgi:hypothetical protein